MTNVYIYTVCGRKFDVIAGTVINFNFQVANLHEVTNRHCSYTNTFKLPQTSVNTSILKANRVAVILEYDSNYFVGYLIVRSEDTEFFEVNFYTELFDFEEQIKELNINMLDFSEFDFIWSVEDADADGKSLRNYFDANDNIITLPIYNNKINNNTCAFYENISPAGVVGIYLKTIVEKLFKLAGWEYSGNILTNSLYNNLVMPLCSFKSLDIDRYNLTVESEYAFKGVKEVSFTDITHIFTQNTQNEYGYFDINTGLKMPKSYFRLNLTFETYMDKNQIEIKLIDDMGVEYSTQNMNYNPIDKLLRVNFYINQFETQRKYKIYLRGFAFLKPSYLYKSTLQTSIIQKSDEFLYQEEYKININLPSYNFSNLLKLLYQIFFIIPIADAKKKHITFLTYNELINNKSDAIDLTKNIDFKSIQKKRLQSYAKKNYISYPADKNGNIYKDFRIIENDALPLEKDFIKLNLPFVAGVTEVFNDIPSVNLDFSNNEFRLLTLQKVESAIHGELKINKYLGGHISLQNYFIPIFSTNYTAEYSLNINYIFNTFYYNFFKTMNEYEAIECNAFLKDINVDNIDITKLYYISDFGAYYYLNKISNYTGKNNLTKIELIKIK